MHACNRHEQVAACMHTISRTVSWLCCCCSPSDAHEGHMPRAAGVERHLSVSVRICVHTCRPMNNRVEKRETESMGRLLRAPGVHSAGQQPAYHRRKELEHLPCRVDLNVPPARPARCETYSLEMAVRIVVRLRSCERVPKTSLVHLGPFRSLHTTHSTRTDMLNLTCHSLSKHSIHCSGHANTSDQGTKQP